MSFGLFVLVLASFFGAPARPAAGAAVSPAYVGNGPPGLVTLSSSKGVAA